MNKANSIRAIDKTDLSKQIKFQLDEISKIENYFIEEINEKKSCSQKLNKYVTTFDYIDKILIVLSATTGGVSLISFTRFTGAASWKSKCRFYFIFFFNNWNNKKIIKYNKKKKKSIIKLLCWLKVNSIELTHKYLKH